MTPTPEPEPPRIFKSGSLSKKSEFRILVTGKIGSVEIDRLIKNLEMEKDCLK